MPYETDDGRVVCEQCGNKYKQIGQHWSNGTTCEYPELSSLKRDILIGLLMGDGWIEAKGRKNQMMCVDWSSMEQCQWIDNILGWLSTGVSLKKSAKSCAERDRNSGFNPDATADSYSDLFRVSTRSHPFITSLTDWYTDDGKIWPENIVFSPTLLLLWYVSDGCYNDKGSNRYIIISLSNEVESENKVSEYFTRTGIPSHSTWYDSERVDGSKKCDAYWSVTESKELFEYMNDSPLIDGKPPDGFEYKFPVEYNGTGKSMVDVQT